MDFTNSFDVKAPIDEVYATLLDVERVAPCVPGAQVIERTGDDAYKVGIKVRVGPISMTYRGDVEVVDKDAAAHQATMQVKARETRGQGTADARVQMALAENGETTHGTMTTQVQLSGRAAAMGRGVIEDVSAKLVDTFAENLATMLSAPAPEPVSEETVEQPTVERPKVGAPHPAAEPAAAAGATATATAPPAAAERPAPPPVQPAAPAQEASLPVLSLVGAAVAGRLRDPRVLAGTLAVVAVVAFRLGRRR
jgi:carbon monoxide dehydrogenase subunit G